MSIDLVSASDYPMPARLYTTDSLGPHDPRFMTRMPGASEIEHLFAAPASVGRGTLSVEGGISIVAGPGMGKTTLLNRLAFTLRHERGVATEIVQLPPIDAFLDRNGFYRYLGAVLANIQESGARASPTDEAHFVTPQIFGARLAEIGEVASRETGLCLLFDDLDRLVDAPWKQAFVAALRFTFQSCPGITPVYALWRLFRDESLPGSNYFRNVTHPIFLSPLTRDGAGGGGRPALVRVGFPNASPEDVARVSALVGGHPLLLHRFLADVVVSGWESGGEARVDSLLTPEAIDAQRQLVGTLLDASPGLAEALKQLATRITGAEASYRMLPKGLIASGLVDEAEGGTVFIPRRVEDRLYRP